MEKENIVYLSLKDLKPYKGNPRKNKDAIDPVAASIKEYGFKSPIVITEDGTIINGHTRYAAAKKLGIDEVPCIVAYDLTPEQAKEFRLIDNKSAEYSQWDRDLLQVELEGLDFNLDFNFDFSGDLKKKKEWGEVKKRCNLKDKIAIRHAEGGYYHSLFKTGKEGTLIADIKVPANVPFFATTAADFLKEDLGGNLDRGDWAILTTPRRRHTDFHFASAVCAEVSEMLGLKFYENAFTCKSKHRIDAIFEMNVTPQERNIILYDDIITTGSTIDAAKGPLLDAGYTVYTLISIDNH